MRGGGASMRPRRQGRAGGGGSARWRQEQLESGITPCCWREVGEQSGTFGGRGNSPPLLLELLLPPFPSPGATPKPEMVGLLGGCQGNAAPGGSRAGLSGGRRGFSELRAGENAAAPATLQVPRAGQGRWEITCSPEHSPAQAERWRAGAGLIGRPEAMDPPSYVNTRLCRT